jgi:hypothetical protein
LRRKRIFSRKNRRFNRIETGGHHFYIQGRGLYGLDSVETAGVLKCHLAHGHGYSLITPDLLFLGTDAARWIQPFGFFPNSIAFFKDQSVCTLRLDVSCGHVLEVEFSSENYIAGLEDDSQLFRCTIKGPDLIDQLATGRSRWNGSSGPEIELFHHTSESNRQAILRSKEFWLSRWNIQGTEKQLQNVGYVYFTALDRIVYEGDLTQIAMAHDGHIKLLTDGDVPEMLDLEVYRASTKDRTATLQFWIESTWLAPQHIWKHYPPHGAVFYEIANPFTHRIGLSPGSTLKLKNEHELEPGAALKRFSYAVVGDCNSLEGLAAPFDEENTKHILKFEQSRPGEDFLSAWKRMANQARYPELSPEIARFSKK